MKTKKALKKLKKKTKKTSGKSLKQLKSLAKKGGFTKPSDKLHAEFQDLSQQVLISAVSELTTPLNPILSWFNEDSTNSPMVNQLRSAELFTEMPKEVAPSKISLTTLPLKSPPCKKCPALKGGRCKCAMKKLAV